MCLIDNPEVSNLVLPPVADLIPAVVNGLNLLLGDLGALPECGGCGAHLDHTVGREGLERVDSGCCLRLLGRCLVLVTLVMIILRLAYLVEPDRFIIYFSR